MTCRDAVRETLPPRGSVPVPVTGMTRFRCIAQKAPAVGSIHWSLYSIAVQKGVVWSRTSWGIRGFGRSGGKTDVLLKVRNLIGNETFHYRALV